MSEARLRALSIVLGEGMETPGYEYVLLADALEELAEAREAGRREVMHEVAAIIATHSYMTHPDPEHPSIGVRVVPTGSLATVRTP